MPYFISYFPVNALISSSESPRFISFVFPDVSSVSCFVIASSYAVCKAANPFVQSDSDGLEPPSYTTKWYDIPKVKV